MSRENWCELLLCSKRRPAGIYTTTLQGSRSAEAALRHRVAHQGRADRRTARTKRGPHQQERERASRPSFLFCARRSAVAGASAPAAPNACSVIPLRPLTVLFVFCCPRRRARRCRRLSIVVRWCALCPGASPRSGPLNRVERLRSHAAVADDVPSVSCVILAHRILSSPLRDKNDG